MIRDTSARRRGLLAAGLCGLLAVAAGCDQFKTRVDLAGTVTMDGKPLPYAVLFVSRQGGEGRGWAEVANGRITFREDIYDLPEGKYRVQLNAMEETDRTVKGPDGERVKEVIDRIPARYNTESALEADLHVGENVLTLDLTSK